MKIYFVLINIKDDKVERFYVPNVCCFKGSCQPSRYKCKLYLKRFYKDVRLVNVLNGRFFIYEVNGYV